MQGILSDVRVVAAGDVGGTYSRIVASDVDTGKEIARVTFPTDADNYSGAFDNVTRAVREVTQGVTLVGAGIAVAGVVDDGVITGSGNLPKWIGKNYGADLSSMLGVPVTVMNDCAAAGMGEYAMFKCPLIYVIWGTGVGVSIVTEVNGLAHAKATELGHMVIDTHSSLMCGCGGLGHLEALVSGGKLSARFGCVIKDITDTQWDEVLADMAAGIRNLSSGDMGLPVVLGGGVTFKQAARIPLLREKVAALPSTCAVPELHLAKSGEDSGLKGAFFAARQLVHG
jgi:predicted NBD/HSP70 family sugar kinase